MPPPINNKDKESDYDDSFENYDDDEFEADDDKKDIKKAIKYENHKAKKILAKNNFNNFSASKPSNKPFLKPSTNGINHSRVSSRGSDRPDFTSPEGGFAMSRGLVVGKKIINHQTANKQYDRTDALKEIIQIEFEEFDNQLNIKPQNKQDLYFNRLQTQQIQNEMVQSNDNYISKDIQTDEIEEATVAVQFPEDFSQKSNEGGVPKSHDLADFMRRVTPVMEQVLEENVLLADLANPQAKEMNPVEQKAIISCPPDMLKVLG